MINTALIGTWHVHFNGYANEAQKNENVKIVALWDHDAEKGKEAAEKYNCNFYSDIDKMLASESIDAVIICTETNLHKDVMLKCANAKKHIFTEKVLCFTESDALEIANAVKTNNIKFTISFPWKCRSDFQWVKSSVDEGLFGQINYCRMRNAHNGTSSGWLPESFYDKTTCGGGAMMDLGAHSMYILNWILGIPEKVSSAFTNVMVNSVEDNAVTMMTYKNGAIGISETGFVAEHNPFEFELVGSKGTVLMGGFVDKPCYNIGNGWIFPVMPPAKPSPLDLWIESIANDTESPFNIDEAVDLSRIMEMAYKNIM